MPAHEGPAGRFRGEAGGTGGRSCSIRAEGPGNSALVDVLGVLGLSLCRDPGFSFVSLHPGTRGSSPDSASGRPSLLVASVLSHPLVPDLLSPGHQ